MNQMYNKPYKIIISFLLIFPNIQLNIAHTQSLAFDTIVAPIVINSDQQKILTYTSNTPHIGNISFVNWNIETIFDTNGILYIMIPNFNQGNPLIFNFEDSYFINNTDINIVGSSANGDISIYLSPNGIIAHINYNSDVFIINPINAFQGVLIRVDNSIINQHQCGVNSIIDDPGDPICLHENCGDGILDILMMITPEADLWLTQTFGSFKSVALRAWANNINGAFIKSKILNKRVRVSFVLFEQGNQYGFLIEDDIDQLTFDQSAIDLLNDYGGDIGIMVTNFASYGNYLGIANSKSPSGLTSKFCIIQATSIQGNYYSLAHEIGHHFGCGHQLEGGIGCARALMLSNGKNTIMTTFQNPYSQIPYFSEPLVSYNGEPTGVINLCENASKIRSTFCQVANINEFSAFYIDFSIESKNYRNCPLICKANILSGYQKVQGNILQCDQNYTYIWSISTNGSTNWTVVGTNSADLVLTNILPKLYFIKLEVLTSNGCYGSYITSRYTPSNGICERNKLHDIKLKPDNQFFPNPGKGIINLHYPDPIKAIKINAINIAGNNLVELTSFTKNENFISIDISSLNDDFWIISIIEDNLIGKYKIIVKN